MNILLFGIAREIVGTDTLTVPENDLPQTVGGLRKWLQEHYPAFGGLSSLAIAVDSNYAADDDLLDVKNEIALIPPVSGG